MTAIEQSTRTIAIIGAGYSGTLCTINLLRQHRSGKLRILLLERSTRHGRGLAYRTWDDNFVLNVPAGNMSALADDAGHFVRYCQDIDPAFNSGSFISRRIYGDYLEFSLQEAIASHPDVTLELICADVSAVRPRTDGQGFRIDTADGRSFSTNQAVLALGHFAPLDPGPHTEFYRSASYINNPWNFPAIDRIEGDAPIALLGAAHTALDVLFRLTSQHDTRKIYLISRRGLSLQPHRFHPQSPAVTGFPAFLEGVEPTVRQYFRALRKQAQQNMAQGKDWRDVINSLRPYTAEIWQRFSLREKRRFLSQAVAYWDIHRHRLAPVAHLRLNQLLKSGQVETIAGYIQGYKIDGDKVSISIQERGVKRHRTLEVCRVVNCTGPSYDINKIDMPLIVQLRDDGYVRQDDLRLGIEVGADYQVIDRNGSPVNNLYYLGPMLKARYWEAIAVPELRGHARRLAEILSL